MKRFSFGVPPLGKNFKDDWTIAGPMVHKNGELHTNLDEVERVTFSQAHRKQGIITDFVLVTPKRARAMRTSNRRVEHESWRDFHLLVLEILAYLETRQPEVGVHMGGGQFRVWIGFFVSLMLTGFLAMMTVAAVAFAGWTPWLVLMVALFMLFGTLTILSKPWDSERHTVSAAEARIQIAELPPINRRSGPLHF